MKLVDIRADMGQALEYGLPPGEQYAKLILALVEIAEAAEALATHDSAADSREGLGPCIELQDLYVYLTALEKL